MVSLHNVICSGNFNLSRYCIPMDQHHRAISVAEERFFSECNTRTGDEFIFVMLSELIDLDDSSSCGAIHQVGCTCVTGIPA